MDPTAALQRFLDACLDDDRDEALEALDDLSGWIRRGGFLPQIERMDDSPHFTVRLPWKPAR
jgi:hypothetical protein